MNSLIKKEYFDLINKLNRSNKHKNQNTEVYFYIDETDSEAAKLYAAISENQKILLSEKDSNDYWKPTYLSGFFHLEEFVVEVINKQMLTEDLTKLIKSHIFKLE